MAVETARLQKEAVRYLAPKDNDYANFTLSTVTDLQGAGAGRVWVFDYYGMATLWDINQVAPPLRAVNTVDGNMGAVNIDNRFLVHRPGANANLTMLSLTGQHTMGATLVDGACCKSLSVEVTRSERELGIPPFGRLNFGMATWFGRASFTANNPSGIALAFLLDARLHLYNTDGSLRSSVAGPRAVPVGYRTKKGPENSGRIDFVPNKETRFAYVSVTSNTREVYALFAGESFGVAGAAGVFAGSEVHIFSWDGAFLRAIRLSEPITKIAVSEGDDVLYGISSTDVVQFKPKDRTSQGK